MKNTATGNLQIQQLINRIEKLEEGGTAPVGAVMFFDLASCPEHWEPLVNKYPDAKGAFIRNISGISRGLGSFQQSAAPNIWGRFASEDSYALETLYYLSDSYRGAFTGEWRTEGGNQDSQNGTYAVKYAISFDASRVSPVYGRDEADEVRPDNIALLACRRFE